MTAFVGLAGAPRNNIAPAWLTIPGIITRSFKDDIIGFVALVAGGSFGNTVIAPNNLVQFSNVISRISVIELDPFIQECIALMPVNSVLATLFIITDRATVNATPAARVIVAPHRLVFA